MPNVLRPNTSGTAPLTIAGTAVTPNMDAAKPVPLVPIPPVTTKEAYVSWLQSEVDRLRKRPAALPESPPQ